MSRELDYPELLRNATLSLVREVLEHAVAEGLPGEHHFFLSFRTADPGVQVPTSLSRQFPETMTIILQHQFWDLEVDDEAFAVTLRFGGDYERLRVPFDAMTAFLDPSVPFGLDFTQFTAAQAADASEREAELGPAPAALQAELAESAELGPVAAPAAEDPDPARGGDLLPFRRKDS